MFRHRRRGRFHRGGFGRGRFHRGRRGRFHRGRRRISLRQRVGYRM